MKKIYLLSLLFMACIGAMSQASLNYNNQANLGAMEQGSTFKVTGTFETTHENTGEPVYSVEVAVMHYATSWSGGLTNQKRDIALGGPDGTGDITAGTIDYTFTIPNDFPLAVAGTSTQFIQTRVWYGTASGNTANGNVFANGYITVSQATDINKSIVETGSVYVTGSTLNIKDASAKTFEIFNLSGTVVEAGSINGSSVQIPLSLAKGIYIVKVGETTTKISL
ncbi:T9SS type A sorting domain-containing protein [Labilibacter marinus]|uniref:T9SS type A sorting domain-containing protein n=1 Tax=Labilibacter marinus TaxID=1477105 RepID=UPI00094F6231|nr:T9SS type A sorting domain-containing protein [Labilibacter marinus]